MGTWEEGQMQLMEQLLLMHHRPGAASPSGKLGPSLGIRANEQAKTALCAEDARGGPASPSVLGEGDGRGRADGDWEGNDARGKSISIVDDHKSRASGKGVKNRLERLGILSEGDPWSLDQSKNTEGGMLGSVHGHGAWKARERGKSGGVGGQGERERKRGRTCVMLFPFSENIVEEKNQKSVDGPVSKKTEQRLKQADGSQQCKGQKLFLVSNGSQPCKGLHLSR